MRILAWFDRLTTNGSRPLCDEPVDDDLDRVVLVTVHLDAVLEVVDRAVDADADEAGAAGVLEDGVVLAFAVGDDGGQEHEPLAGGQGEDGVDDLLHGLLLDRAAAGGAGAGGG